MRKSITIALGVALVALAAVPAWASETATEATPDASLAVRGPLTAKGRGDIAVQGSGKVVLAVTGDVTITGAEHVVIRPADEDKRVVDDESTIVLEGFRGIVVIRGEDFTVEATGRVHRLVASGRGTAFLQGKGWWAGLGAQGRWSEDGIRIRYGS